MSWEAPLMEAHAVAVANQEGWDVLNIGFGLGLVDAAIQKRNPRTHTIIEAHPQVHAKMLELGWDKKPGVRIVFGRWQDVMDQLGQYDGGICFLAGRNGSNLPLQLRARLIAPSWCLVVQASSSTPTRSTMRTCRSCTRSSRGSCAPGASTRSSMGSAPATTFSTPSTASWCVRRVVGREGALGCPC